MSITIKFFAALLIVFSAASAYSNTKGVNRDVYCEVKNVGKTRKIQLIYKGLGLNDVRVTLMDESQQEVYSETLYNTEEFAKTYELSNLPDGAYTVQLRAGKFEYSKDVLVESWKAENIDFLLSGKDKVALIGKNDSGGEVTLRLRDRHGRTLLSEHFDNGKTINKVYNLSEIRPAGATFHLINDGEIIKSFNSN